VAIRRRRLLLLQHYTDDEMRRLKSIESGEEEAGWRLIDGYVWIGVGGTSHHMHVLRSPYRTFLSSVSLVWCGAFAFAWKGEEDQRTELYGGSRRAGLGFGRRRNMI
jgi:hypothetical protein